METIIHLPPNRALMGMLISRLHCRRVAYLYRHTFIFRVTYIGIMRPRRHPADE